MLLYAALIAAGVFYFKKYRTSPMGTLGFDDVTGTPFKDVFMDKRKTYARDVNTVFDPSTGVPTHNAANYHVAQGLDSYMDDECPFPAF